MASAGGADDGHRQTHESVVVDAKARALAGVEPLAESDGAIRLAVGGLADSGPDSCWQRKCENSGIPACQITY